MIAILLKLIGSAAFGSITGFLGSYLKGRQEISKLKVNNAFELQKLAADQAMKKT